MGRHLSILLWLTIFNDNKMYFIQQELFKALYCSKAMEIIIHAETWRRHMSITSHWALKPKDEHAWQSLLLIELKRITHLWL